MLFRSALSLALLGGTIYLFMVTPKGFLPRSDSPVRIIVSTEAFQGISFEDMVEHQVAVSRIVEQHPWVRDAAMLINNGNRGAVMVHPRLRAEGAPPADKIIQELRPKLAGIPGLRVFLTNPPAITIGSQSTRSIYQFTLQGTDTDELYHYAPMLEDKLRQLPGLEDVSSDLLIKNPQVNRSEERRVGKECRL